MRQVEVAEIVDRLGADDVGGSERSRLLARLAAALLARARAAGGRAVLTGRALADAVADLAPHVPVRDLATLRAHHGGLTGDALAESLVASASRTTAGIGAAGGALAAAQLAAPPSLVVSPLQVAAETVAIVLVEVKLVAELHVAHGVVALGPPGVQAAAYLQAWVNRRGLDDSPVPGLSAVVATAARSAAARAAGAPVRPQPVDAGAVPRRGGRRRRAQPPRDPGARRRPACRPAAAPAPLGPDRPGRRPRSVRGR